MSSPKPSRINDEVQNSQEAHGNAVCKQITFAVVVKMESMSREPSPSHTCEARTLENQCDKESENKWRCRLCMKCFKDKQECNNHEETHLNWYKCDVCAKKFLTKDHLTCHERIHTGEKPYQCSICFKRFARSSTLNVHKRIHSNKKPFSCTFCDRFFKHGHTLKAHMLLHTGKQFSCNMCKKSFTEKRKLRKHITVHTGDKDKPFSCDICSKKFAFKYVCVRHELDHAKATKYTCGECKKSYPTRKDLWKHRGLQHKVFSCTVCMEQFDEKSVLDLHKSVHLT